MHPERLTGTQRLEPDYAGISVIVPCYRCHKTIERAVASVAAQTLLPAELILVDDCSGDETLALLNRLQSKYPEGWIKVVSSPVNGGAAKARNVGWVAATQDYIAFLDADDIWHPQKVAIQYGWMIKHPDVTLTGHACSQIGAEANAQAHHDALDAFSSFYRIRKNQLLLSNLFQTPSVMMRRDTPLRFPDGKRYSEDYQLWLEICCAGWTCCRTDIPLAFLFKSAYGDGGLSSALWRMEKGELDSYQQIYRKGYITWSHLIGLRSWSFIKYLRRIANVYLRKLPGLV